MKDNVRETHPAIENILSRIKTNSHSRILIFGNGCVGKLIYKTLRDAGLNEPVSFVDNNYQNLGVMSPSEASGISGALWIIGSEQFNDEMIRQAIQLGVDESDICCDLQLLTMIQRRIYLTVEYEIVDHCNLNCAGCLNFCQHAKPRFAVLDEFKLTFARYLRIVGEQLAWFGIMGGEPLLHPQVSEFLILSREMYQGKIILTTNGLLLQKMPSKFWKTCHNNRIDIIVSAYPVHLKYSKIVELADFHNVNIEIKSKSDAHAWSYISLTRGGGGAMQNRTSPLVRSSLAQK
ncbi:MAG: 4Fe-4S cluster-binding domain-containing protein [Candidatus Accumulibacter sp.]|jgi:ABC-2 type transport system ATP-binding protein|nr:4Fe-4S cluster-binding domain-containing protein [Accumulibacter sp.]